MDPTEEFTLADCEETKTLSLQIITALHKKASHPIISLHALNWCWSSLCQAMGISKKEFTIFCLKTLENYEEPNDRAAASTTNK